jgi:hypothetical protein
MDQLESVLPNTARYTVQTRSHVLIVLLALVNLNNHVNRSENKTTRPYATCFGTR